MNCGLAVVVATIFAWCGSLVGAAETVRWEALTAKKGLSEWLTDAEGQAWRTVGEVSLDGKKQKSLAVRNGKGTIVSLDGKCADLKSRCSYGDVDVSLEFLIPRGSNSGVKLMGLYEIQIYDSNGVAEPTANDCGGVYPRAEPHWIDRGTPPKLNAAKPAGEWQTLEISFHAPRKNERGQKTANAKFVRVALNGRVIHENVEVEHPTGKAWRIEREVSRGPLLLQGDHGPVAFRNVRVRERTTH